MFTILYFIYLITKILLLMIFDLEMIIMREKLHYTSVKFINYKAFLNFTIKLKDFNVLVGPNNSGKSTILGAFRILNEAMRKARTRKPEIIQGPEGSVHGYNINLDKVPVATENVFTNYNDKEPASITFKISNGNELILFFPKEQVCFLICNTKGLLVTSPSIFKKEYNISIGFVPVLGPLDHHELLYQKEAARLALLTPTASRNFRNVWLHYNENFEEFSKLIKDTWPGMEIGPPEIDTTHAKPRIHMFCPEDRFPREIFWAGFGFQVWCQMLTFIVKNKDCSLFIIDEPDIYLHSDLQCQIVNILKELGPDILIATHSTEIISEVEPDNILSINKKYRTARRIKNISQLQQIFSILGSNLNPTITQLAKTRRVIFVEGKDFRIISIFARKLNNHKIANRSDFAVIPVDGFNAKKVKNFLQGMEITLGMSLLSGVIFDRDYRSQTELNDVIQELEKNNNFAYIHSCKEIENFLLEPNVIRKTIKKRIKDIENRSRKKIKFTENVKEILSKITEEIRHEVMAQYLSKRRNYEKRMTPNYDDATIDARVIKEFTKRWDDFDERLKIVPGKKVLSKFNTYLQDNFSISISNSLIASQFKNSEIPEEVKLIIGKIENLRMTEFQESK